MGKAWTQSFNNGGQANSNRNTNRNVRAVRGFLTIQIFIYLTTLRKQSNLKLISLFLHINSKIKNKYYFIRYHFNKIIKLI